MRVLLLPFTLVILSLTVSAAYDSSLYLCSVCMSSVENSNFNSEDNSETNTTEERFLQGCHALFSKENCDLFFGHLLPTLDFKGVINEDSFKHPRETCQSLQLCPISVDPLQSTTSALISAADPSNIDVRVSKAIGSRGYNKVRVSVISNSSVASKYFDYHSQFKYRWTSKYLNSGVLTVDPGVKTTFSLTGSTSIDILIPLQGAGVRGVILADPCFQSEWIFCAYKDKFQMYNHSIELLNAINAHDDVSFWQILGDNFYDQEGTATANWFAGLSLSSKSKVFQTVPGNHDFWVNASPTLQVPGDQLGNGFMQYYAQDVIASVQATQQETSAPYDFSSDPDKGTRGSEAQLPIASDFFWYNQMGNIGFIGYSGAHSFSAMSSYFEEACTWAASTVDVQTVLLLGHWNSPGDGCPSESAVPSAYKELLTTLPACAPLASKLRYFEGHKHCNTVVEENVGFMVGANGMSDKDCAGEFGIPVVDSTGDSFKVYYFPIAQVNGFDNYEEILACFKSHGVSGCYHLAKLWSSTPLL